MEEVKPRSWYERIASKDDEIDTDEQSAEQLPYFVGRCSMTDHVPTFADLCCAIAEGRIAATVDGSMYTINASELRRYFNKSRSLPTISSPDSQIPVFHSEAGNWSGSVQSSLA